MLVKVLESISEMLDKALNAPQDGPAITKVYVECAKSLVDKTIEEQKPRKGPMPVGKAITIDPQPIEPSIEETYEFVVTNGKLDRINRPDGSEVDDSVMIELDGMAYNYSRAKGRTFKNGRVC